MLLLLCCCLLPLSVFVWGGSDFVNILDAAKKAWPDWEPRFLGAEKQEDGTWKVKTQQAIGRMKADFKPGGPLPDLLLKDAPESWTTGLGSVLPVEVGTYIMSADGSKVLSGAYMGTIDTSL